MKFTCYTKELQSFFKKFDIKKLPHIALEASNNHLHLHAIGDRVGSYEVYGADSSPNIIEEGWCTLGENPPIFKTIAGLKGNDLVTWETDPTHGRYTVTVGTHKWNSKMGEFEDIYSFPSETKFVGVIPNGAALDTPSTSQYATMPIIIKPRLGYTQTFIIESYMCKMVRYDVNTSVEDEPIYLRTKEIEIPKGWKSAPVFVSKGTPFRFWALTAKVETIVLSSCDGVYYKYTPLENPGVANIASLIKMFDLNELDKATVGTKDLIRVLKTAKLYAKKKNIANLWIDTELDEVAMSVEWLEDRALDYDGAPAEIEELGCMKKTRVVINNLLGIVKSFPDSDRLRVEIGEDSIFISTINRDVRTLLAPSNI